MTTDFREAVRSFWAQPGFSLVVVLTLALAIGINSAIFSVLNGVLLRPLDYADPGRLVVLWESNPAAGQPQSETSGATYLDWRARTRALPSLGAFRSRGFTLRIGGESEHIASVEASPALFRVLGVSPIVGRVFTDEEEQPGTRDARDPEPRRVAAAFRRTVRRRGPDDRSSTGNRSKSSASCRRRFSCRPAIPTSRCGRRSRSIFSRCSRGRTGCIGRSGAWRPGRRSTAAQADMDAIARGPGARASRDQRGVGRPRSCPAHDQVVGDIGGTLWILFGAVVLVLLIACANIANLLLARSARAAKDFSIRAALGAGRGVLVRRSLVESGVLALSGAVVGLGARMGGRPRAATPDPAHGAARRPDRSRPAGAGVHRRDRRSRRACSSAWCRPGAPCGPISPTCCRRAAAG